MSISGSNKLSELTICNLKVAACKDKKNKEWCSEMILNVLNSTLSNREKSALLMPLSKDNKLTKAWFYSISNKSCIV